MNILPSQPVPYQSQHSATMLLSHPVQNAGAVFVLSSVLTPVDFFSTSSCRLLFLFQFCSLDKVKTLLHHP